MSRRINPFEKIDQLFNLTKIILPDLKFEQFKTSIENLFRVSSKERSLIKLTKTDFEIKRILDQKKIKPVTARWYFRANYLPPVLKIRVKNKTLSYSEALKIHSNVNIQGNNNLKKEILQDIRSYINKLQKKEFIGLEDDNDRRGY